MTDAHTDLNFMLLFAQVQAEIHRTAVDKGWWQEDRSDDELIATMHRKLWQALEALRQGNPPDDKIPDYRGVEAELADTIIRIMDMAERRGWNVAGALVAKKRHNKTRETRYGGKAF